MQVAYTNSRPWFILIKAIKRDIDIVEMDVKKSNQLLQAEQELR